MALLIQQHKELHQLSLKKTDLIKRNDIHQLHSLLKEESTLIRKMEETERARHKATLRYLEERDNNCPEGTVSELVKYLPEGYRNPLVKLQENLLLEMTRLREREAMNRMLLEDSLHFVQMTMDMIQPDPEAVHYTHPESKGGENVKGYSVFDSKA